MAEYHVTRFYGVGITAKTTIRRRVDAATYAFRRAVFDMIESNGMRDREAGWAAHSIAIEKADAIERGWVKYARVELCGSTVLIERLA